MRAMHNADQGRFVNKKGMEYWKVRGSKPGTYYYVTPHKNPAAKGRLWTCSCPSFTMGRVAAGLNPFEHPCKHIIQVQAQLKEAKSGRL